VLLEAMAYGLPIIASDIGGVAEVLGNGSCGVLVLPGEADLLRDAIVRMARDAALRDRVSAAARERLRENYAWR
jgi:glycosyltransferase involved in cell wall biosynthesis